jgi:hypothetical protein
MWTMRHVPRQPKNVHPAVMAAIVPLFRQSMTRDAYVLRGVGHRFGPVLRPRRDAACAPVPAQRQIR